MFLFYSGGGTHPHWPHNMDLPGGDVEEGEDVISAQAREIFEETGVSFKHEDFLLVKDVQPNKERRQVVYSARLDEVKPKISISWEHEKYEWINAKELLGRKDAGRVDQMFLVAQQALEGLLAGGSVGA